jgi:hypothetical protein
MPFVVYIKIPWEQAKLIAEFTVLVAGSRCFLSKDKLQEGLDNLSSLAMALKTGKLIIC